MDEAIDLLDGKLNLIVVETPSSLFIDHDFMMGIFDVCIQRINQSSKRI
jgi:hypothetical protein